MDTILWQNMTIVSNLSISNKSIFLEGNLVITNRSSLRCFDSEIILNPLSNGSNGILANDDSSFEINNCTIRSTTGYSYNIYIRDSSEFYLIDSVIRNCGFLCVSLNQGLVIEKSIMVAENLTLYHNGYGIISRESTIYLNYCFFYPNETYSNGFYSLDAIKSGRDPIRNDITIRNCSFGRLDVPPDSYIGGSINTLGANLLVEHSLLHVDYCFFDCATLNNVEIRMREAYDGIRISDFFASFSNCTISNTLGEAILVNKAQAFFTNCTLDGNPDLKLASSPNDYARLDLINTSVISYKLNNNISYINFSQFLNSKVINKHDLSPIGNVTAKAFDANGKPVFEGKTADDGTINWIPLMWKQVKNQETRLFTPHRIFITKGNASANVTGINMSVNREIVIPFDDSPPSLVITNPQDGTVTNRSDINVAGFIDTDSSLMLNGQTITTGGGPFNITYWLDEGDNLLTFKGKDDFGNTVQKVIHVTLMTVPPSINLTEPDEGAVTNLNPIMVKGWTNGSRVEINGVPVSLGAAGNFTYSWNILVEGKQTVSVNAWDRANNSRTLRRNIFYDITPPEIEFVSPLNNSWTGIGTVDVTIRLPDAVNAKVDGTSKAPGTGGVITFRKSLNEGENRISILAWDAAGNANSTTLAINLDTSNFLELTEPSGDILTNRTMLTVKGRTEKGATVLISGEPGDNIDGNFTFSIGLKEGMNKITAVSTDRAGNRAERTSAVTLDTISPELTVISPTELISKEARITIKLRSETGANVTVNGVRANVTGDTYTCDVVLVKGENNFVLSANDLAGNANSTSLIISYVPPKPPAPDPTVENGFLLPAVIIAAIITILLLSFFILRRRNMKQ
jgi:hypothetical protein